MAKWHMRGDCSVVACELLLQKESLKYAIRGSIETGAGDIIGLIRSTIYTCQAFPPTVTLFKLNLTMSLHVTEFCSYAQMP